MRLRKIREQLAAQEKFPYIIFSLKNIQYLIGFKGSNGYLVIAENTTYFITDSRYAEYAESMLPANVEFVLQEGSLIDTLDVLQNKIKQKTYYLEEHSVTLSMYLLLKNRLPEIEFRSGGDEVDDLRIVKDENELDILRQAARLTDACMEHLCGYIKPGITEWDISIEIEYFYKKHGCRKTSFESIVASGKGASMPHYTTSMRKKIEPGDAVLIDMGCEYEGYNSDLTRTIFVDSVAPEIEKIYHIVKHAQETAVSHIKAGKTTGDIDAIARTIIADAGYGANFGHSLGHGVGLDVHELPAVKTGGDQLLLANSIVTIEPGIYLPQKGGVRIEDMVLVKENSHEVMTCFTKDIKVI